MLYRERLSEPRTYYVRDDGDNANDGLEDTPTGAWATLQYAYDCCCDNLDTAGHCIRIEIDGDFTTGIISNRGLIGSAGTASFIINGKPGTALTTPGDAFQFGESCGFGAHLSVTIDNIKISSGGHTFRVLGAGANVCVGSGVELGNAGGMHFFIGHSAWVDCGKYKVSGDAQYHAYVYSGGKFILEGNGIHFLNPVTMTYGGIIVTGAGSECLAGGAVFTNSGWLNAMKYFIDQNAVINTGNMGPNYLPGLIPGQIHRGGVLF